ncbi:MAG: ribosome-associated translation inhibitor RaiA [Bryobacteraceae bacterium]|nr:ribosome-associated translation inhibitor RaiA [Bryobacteraceae bacterium]
MKVTYTGKTDKLLPEQEKKLEARFSKLGKLFDRKGEKEARVIIKSERHLHHAEITANWYDNPIVCTGSDPDLFSAICQAVDKLEKQIVKLRSKWRDTKRTAPKGKAAKAAPETATEEQEAAGTPVEPAQPQIFRVNNHSRRKPMTIEEAILEMEKRDYLVYRDADTDRLSVLLRRRDGNFDLVQA